MKKNNTLFIFIIILSFFIIGDVRATKKEHGVTNVLRVDNVIGGADSARFQCQGDVFTAWFKAQTGLVGIDYLECPKLQGTGVMYYDNPNNPQYILNVGIYKFTSAGNTWVQMWTGLFGGDSGSFKGYGKLARLNKYNGSSVDEGLQIISNDDDMYSVISEVNNGKCYALVDHGGVGHNDEIWLSDSKSELEEIKKSTSGIDSNAKILMRLSTTGTVLCTNLAKLEENKTEYNKLKTERAQYQKKDNKYKEITKKMISVLNEREKILDELEKDRSYNMSADAFAERRLLTRLLASLNASYSNRGDPVKGCDVFGENITPIIKWGINLIRIGGTVLVIVLGVVDFMNILLSGEEKNFKEAGMKFIKRLIALIILIFIPYLITFLLDLSGLLKQYDIDDIYCVVKF